MLRTKHDEAMTKGMVTDSRHPWWLKVYYWFCYVGTVARTLWKLPFLAVMQDEHTRKLVELGNGQDDLAKAIDSVDNLVGSIRATVRAHTSVNLDWNKHGSSHVILMGRYEGSDYVEITRLPEKEFAWMVEHIKQLGKSHTIGFMDDGHAGMLSACFKRLD